jgi:hypothetical protein
VQEEGKVEDACVVVVDVCGCEEGVSYVYVYDDEMVNC